MVCVTHAFVENLVSRGISRDKLRVVTNGADIAHFEARPKDEALLEQLGLRGRFVAGYIGTLGLAHGLDTLLDAARLLAARPDAEAVRLFILGDGAERAAIQARIVTEGLQNVLLLDRVPRDQVARYWSILDVAIIHLRKSDLFKTVIPSKLFECMAMGIPVLHGVEGESAEIVTRTGVGILVEPGNPQAMSDALGRLVHDPQALAAMRAAGPRAAREYDRRTLAARMLGFLLSVTGR